MSAAVQSQTTAPAVAAVPPAPARLMRACDCGKAAPGPSGQCPDCSGKSRFGADSAVALGAPDDQYEQEADRVAEQMMAGAPLAAPAGLGMGRLQRQEVEEEEEELLQAKPGALQRQEEQEEEELLQAKSSGTGSTAAAAAPAAAAAVTSGGQPLAASERAFFEPRFGHDLSHVRLHTDAGASHAARGIGARAYTLGQHIAFAPGEYAPSTREGRRLLAHELTHTLQQNGHRTLRRTCPSDPAQIPAGSSKDFEEAVDAIRALEVYRKLSAEGRGKADHIIDGARGSACPMYYIERLRVLFDTPLNPSKKTTEEIRGMSIEAAEKEQDRLESFGMDEFVGVEERATRNKQRQWRTVEGMAGYKYRIDDADPTRVYVHMKVYPRAKGAGTEEDVKRTLSLEDGIETAALRQGYVLDVEFVKHTGKDVFPVGVDPSKWITAGNWVGATRALAHEAHHLLNLEDRYDYLHHAENKAMPVENRLHWFREQMVRGHDTLREQSIMGSKKRGSPSTSRTSVRWSGVTTATVSSSASPCARPTRSRRWPGLCPTPIGRRTPRCCR